MKFTILALAATTALAFSQGPLLPPGAPAPTQKSLEEIWNKIGVLEAQNSSLQVQLSAVSGLNAISAAGMALPWNLETVDAAGFTGYFTSLAFSPDGQPAISYYDGTNGDLRFARFNGTSWATAAVDAVGFTGYYTSLAFGPDGQPAISYRDTNNFLKFARFNGSTWATATVDAVGSTGFYTSLAFGPDGQPAISYYDNSNGDLRFARKGLFQPAP